MNVNPPTHRIAVCSWSLRPDSPRALIDQLKKIGIPRIQLALDPLRESPEIWGETAALCKQEGIEIVSGMFGCVGEDYSTLESIQATGGLTPDATWEQNWKNMQSTAALAQELGLTLVTMHAGFVPHDTGDALFSVMVQRLRQAADLFADRHILLGLETGQETAEALALFLTELDRANLRVNFDPANMILYDKGNPVDALQPLGPWIRQIHIKDAKPTQTPGTWGEEAPVGTGNVHWPAFFQTLRQLHFNGDFCIEREAGEQRDTDILAARDFIRPFLLCQL